jgi:hypothetical protein
MTLSDSNTILSNSISNPILTLVGFLFLPDQAPRLVYFPNESPQQNQFVSQQFGLSKANYRNLQ